MQTDVFFLKYPKKILYSSKTLCTKIGKGSYTSQRNIQCTLGKT